MPPVGGRLTKQTVYLLALDCWHWKTNHTQARIMLVDDDSEEGVFQIKRICDDLGVKAAFAVIPSRIDNVLGDSLRQWQKEGFGICLHGYNHDQWREWNYEAVINDIRSSINLLKKMGFCTEIIKYVVPPHSSNTRNIRQAINDVHYQMISGASLVNPDSEQFLLGRIFISKDTDMQKIQYILEKAKKRKMFVILGTHSSNPDEFSYEKTKSVLRMALNMGFDFYY